MAEYVYIGAGMNVSLPPMFRKWIALVEVASNDRKTDLVHVPGNLTAVMYRDEILQPHLMHIIDRQWEVFQQDNAMPHTARVTMDYLDQNNINVLPWPSKSPDLNPIEHLDKRVRQRQTLDQPHQMLQQEWRTIPRNNVRNLIESMPRRCRTVVVIHGTNFNVTGSVLNCDKFTYLLKYELLIFQ